MKEERLENLRDYIDLYLSMDSSVKTGSVLKACQGGTYVEPTLDLILVKEELWNRILEESNALGGHRG